MSPLLARTLAHAANAGPFHPTEAQFVSYRAGKALAVDLPEEVLKPDASQRMLGVGVAMADRAGGRSRLHKRLLLPTADWAEGIRPREQGVTAAALELDAKRLATAKARCALWGGVLLATEGDDGRPLILITRWALTVAFRNLDEVKQWLDRVGAKR